MHVNGWVVFLQEETRVGHQRNFSMRTRPAVVTTQYFLKNDDSMVSTTDLKGQGIHAIAGFIDLSRFTPLLKSRHPGVRPPGMSRTDPAWGAA